MSQPPYPPPPPPGPPPYGPPPGPAWAPPPEPPRTGRAVAVVLAVVAAVVVLAAAILVPWLLTRDDDGDREAEGGPGSPGSEGAVDTSNLDLVQSYDDLTTRHIEPGESVDYPQSPAVGGDHAPYWLECGVHDEPIPEASAVHDLEHGTTWITYRDDLVDDDGVDRLAEQLPDNGIMSPYPDQEAPVVITVWGRQLELLGPDDPRIALFVEEYGAGDTAPEPFASCNGGIDPDDVPDSDVAA